MIRKITSSATATKAAAGMVVPAPPPARQVSIVGAHGFVQAGVKGHQAPPRTTTLIRKALTQALDEAQLQIRHLDALIAVPSLTENHFMEAHYQATRLGMFDERPHLRCKTIDTGGAGPISALLEGVRMIQSEGLECVAVVAADCVGSLPTETFLHQADEIFVKLQTHRGESPTVSPAIPHGYDRLTEYQMESFGLERDQLRMAVCLQSFHAGMHPESLFRQKLDRRTMAGDATNTTTTTAETLEAAVTPPLFTPLQTVRDAPLVTPHLSVLECARRADGAACLILASNRFLARQGLYGEGMPTVIGGGESSGPLYPKRTITEAHFSCEQAMRVAYASAGNLIAKDIDFFGLYDCFPICLVRALEAAGLCGKGQGGAYLEREYHRLLDFVNQEKSPSRTDHSNNKKMSSLPDDFFPVNTHGGLLCYGAPWEVPAMFNVIEAVHQLKGTAKGRQLQDCRRALVYGNGGILSASAVAILSKSL